MNGSPLARSIARRIALAGPLTVADYMAEVLVHPRHGVYGAGDPLGAGGHFVTAPEISQMFGELIGAWCAVIWRGLGFPDPLRLVELGPGRGTLLADALRATRRVAGFHAALRLHLVEIGESLRARQRMALDAAGWTGAVAWHETFADVPDGPFVAIANEFFDALPIRQFQRGLAGWGERLIDAAPDGGLRFVVAPAPAAVFLLPPALRDSPVGSIVEVSPPGIALAAALGARATTSRGAALVIDYGHVASVPGATLQAVRHHRFHDPLDDPGSADLTAHVDFAVLGSAARERGAAIHGPVPQGEFLERIGLSARAESLAARADAAQRRAIQDARRRLAGDDGMGSLFKVIAIADPALGLPPGFEPPAGVCAGQGPST